MLAVPVPAPIDEQYRRIERQPRVERHVVVDARKFLGESAGAAHGAGAHDDAARARHEQLATGASPREAARRKQGVARNPGRRDDVACRVLGAPVQLCQQLGEHRTSRRLPDVSLRITTCSASLWGSQTSSPSSRATSSPRACRNRGSWAGAGAQVRAAFVDEITDALGIEGGVVPRDVGAAIGGAVVAEEQLPMRVRLRPHAFDRLGEVRTDLEERHHDRDERRVAHGRRRARVAHGRRSARAASPIDASTACRLSSARGESATTVRSSSRLAPRRPRAFAVREARRSCRASRARSSARCRRASSAGTSYFRTKASCRRSASPHRRAARAG